MSQRNTKTSASLRAYVTAELGPSALPSEPDATNLKVAITNSGGGKRAFFNSIGKCTVRKTSRPTASRGIRVRMCQSDGQAKSASQNRVLPQV